MRVMMQGSHPRVGMGVTRGGSSTGIRAQAHVAGSPKTPRHKPTVEPLDPGNCTIPKLSGTCGLGLSAPKLLQPHTARLPSCIPRGAIRTRTTERPSGAKTTRKQKPPEPPTEEEKQENAYHFVRRLPFVVAQTFAKTESHWLKQRNRSRWWKRGKFPKTPKDTVRDALKDESIVPTEILFKMAPLGVVFFSATFNLCLLQNLKDTIMITQVGAETLPFLAAFGVLPATMAFFGYYNTLVNRLPVKTVFYAAVLPLITFYVAFATFLYPSAHILHPTGILEAASHYVPLGLHGLLKCVEYWTYSTFFCIAELWGSVVISLLFWSMANDVCTVQEAKTIYPLMGISANVALIAAGNFIKKLPMMSPQGTLRVLIGTVVGMTAIMMAGKFFLDTKVLPSIEKGEKLKNMGKKKKSKGSFKEGIAVLRESAKIRNLALLVVGCSISHRLFDVAWKGQLKLVFPSAIEYQTVLADVSVWTGMTTIGAMVAGKFVFQYLGWGVAAAATPIVMLATGSVFFALSIMYNTGTASVALATLGAVAGNITQVVCKASKYSLFDPAKEMVYIEMSKEEKIRGKAAVDLVGNQLGKTGASWLSQGLLVVFGSIAKSMPCIAGLYTAVLVTWTAAVFKLQGQLKETERQRALAVVKGDGSIMDSMDEDAIEKPPPMSGQKRLVGC